MCFTESTQKHVVFSFRKYRIYLMLSILFFFFVSLSKAGLILKLVCVHDRVSFIPKRITERYFIQPSHSCLWGFQIKHRKYNNIGLGLYYRPSIYNVAFRITSRIAPALLTLTKIPVGSCRLLFRSCKVWTAPPTCPQNPIPLPCSQHCPFLASVTFGDSMPHSRSPYWHFISTNHVILCPKTILIANQVIRNITSLSNIQKTNFKLALITKKYT